MSDVPEVVTRYLAAADARRPHEVAECFAPDGTVLDEGRTYTGHEEIRAWREETAGKWTYTTKVTGGERVSADEYRATVRVEGDFPGGVADLAYGFRLADGLITALRIVE